jgi:hypothetical protein
MISHFAEPLVANSILPAAPLRRERTSSGLLLQYQN